MCVQRTAVVLSGLGCWLADETITSEFSTLNFRVMSCNVTSCHPWCPACVLVCLAVCRAWCAVLGRCPGRVAVVTLVLVSSGRTRRVLGEVTEGTPGHRGCGGGEGVVRGHLQGGERERERRETGRRDVCREKKAHRRSVHSILDLPISAQYKFDRDVRSEYFMPFSGSSKSRRSCPPVSSYPAANPPSSPPAHPLPPLRPFSTAGFTCWDKHDTGAGCPAGGGVRRYPHRKFSGRFHPR